MSYPKWMYHAESADEPKLIKSAEHLASLSPGWADSPYTATEFAPIADPASDVEVVTLPKAIRRVSKAGSKT